MIRTGIGFDTHRLVVDRKLILGGVEIENELGLDGHSDADVLCHAVMDALLGSIAEGDIGLLFPDTDEQWKDAWSIELLKEVCDLLRRKKASINNVDVTVIAEKPMLKDYIYPMRSNLSNAIGIPVDCISVKATTAEKMGSLGRGEGIGALALATVEQGRSSQAN